jgi:hypothetical protein
MTQQYEVAVKVTRPGALRPFHDNYKITASSMSIACQQAIEEAKKHPTHAFICIVRARKMS